MKIRKWSIGLSAGTIFIFLFKTVYNYFGHGVTSAAMDTAWLFPLGLLIFFWGIVLVDRQLFSIPTMKTAMKVLLASMLTVVTGRLLTGVFEIAGTGSNYLSIYSISAGILLFLGLCLIGSAVVQQFKRKEIN